MSKIEINLKVNFTAPNCLMAGMYQLIAPKSKVHSLGNLGCVISWNTFRLIDESKVCSSYCPLAYFSDIFISGKNVVISHQKWQHFPQKWKYRKNMQVDHNLNGLYYIFNFGTSWPKRNGWFPRFESNIVFCNKSKTRGGGGEGRAATSWY